MLWLHRLKNRAVIAEVVEQAIRKHKLHTLVELAANLITPELQRPLQCRRVLVAVNRVLRVDPSAELNRVLDHFLGGFCSGFLLKRSEVFGCVPHNYLQESVSHRTHSPIFIVTGCLALDEGHEVMVRFRHCVMGINLSDIHKM